VRVRLRRRTRRRVGWGRRLTLHPGILVLAVLLGLPPRVHAQGEPLAPGRMARLFVRGLVAPLEGTLVEVGPERTRIDTPDGVLAVSNTQVERSEVLGSRANTLRGAVIGLGVGLGVGVGLVIHSKDDCQPTVQEPCTVPGEGNEEWRLAIPGLAGAAVGALVGSQIRTSAWVPGFYPGGAVGSPGVGMVWRVPLG